MPFLVGDSACAARPELGFAARHQLDTRDARRVDDHADDGKGDLPRDDEPLGGGDDQVPDTGEPGGGRLLLRLGHCVRRQRHATRGIHPAGTWAEMIKPHYKKLCDWIHANTSWKTFLHSCGSVKNLLPHFIEAGIDILNPVQTSAANMDPAQLKTEFGGQFVFWGGGCDTQSILGHAMPDEIRRAR